jgi:uncharacterized protein YjbI with pentapeptide repeats
MAKPAKIEAPGNRVPPEARPPQTRRLAHRRRSPLIPLMLVAIGIIAVGIGLNLPWLGLAGAMVALILAVGVLLPQIQNLIQSVMTEQQRALTVALLSLGAVGAALLQFTRLNLWLRQLWLQVNWEAVGALGDAFGALGQILIAILALYIAWRQYVIEKDLTTQQNLITQQQTIDSYFQGISDLVLDEEGLLEDWPQERAIAEGRTAAILSSADAEGKAKVLRFLSRSKLLTPLKRDRRLGRAILDGSGGYAEDRAYGIRVIDLGVMLATADLANTDLRWTDLSDANLIRANLSDCDLVKANVSRTILYGADLSGTDLMGTRFFYGSPTTATPRTRDDLPNYDTGAYTGTVIENADFSEAQRMSEEQRWYCCAWGGSKTRATVPGGCGDIPDLLAQQRHAPEPPEA